MTEHNQHEPVAFRDLDEVRMVREKIIAPAKQAWARFGNAMKRDWDALRGKPSGDFKLPVRTARVKNTETLAEAVARLQEMGIDDPGFNKRAERALRLEQERETPRLKKRAIIKTAAGNFRHSWKDAFAGMKLRYFLIPNSKKIDPARMSWTQAKSISSIIGGAAVGGALGIMAYALPYVFISALYTGLPLLALGVGVRAVGVLIPKGDLNKAVHNIGKKTFALGVVCGMWPMVAIGTVAFGGIHAALTVGETLVKGFTASLRATVDTARGYDLEAADALRLSPAAKPAKTFAADAPQAGADFAQAAQAAAQQSTDAQPAPTTTKAATPRANQ